MRAVGIRDAADLEDALAFKARSFCDDLEKKDSVNLFSAQGQKAKEAKGGNYAHLEEGQSHPLALQ